MKIAVAISGGVDSSVVACLLKQQGHDVFALNMDIGSPACDGAMAATTNNPAKEQHQADIKQVCDHIGISYQIIDFAAEFKKNVFTPFVNEYALGRTPNPCVICNVSMKFGLLLQKAIELGADHIATGHYARMEFSEQTKRFHLFKGVDKSKDQSYFLYGLTKPVTEKIIFPLGAMTKSKVRELADDFGLVTAEKSESQDVCFISDNESYTDFVCQDKRLLDVQAGDVVHINGEILGKHKGFFRYTIGQRRGLGIAYHEPIYVLDLLPEKNLVIVGSLDDLFHQNMIVENLSLVQADELEDGMKVNCKIRSRSKEQAATIFKLDSEIIKGSKVLVKFNEAQKAITPGQAAAFYLDDEVIGGGRILKSGKND